MSGNSGSEGAASGFDGPRYSRKRYEQALSEFRDVLENAEVVGWPRRSTELYELQRLIKKYPDEAKEFLDASDGI